MPLLVDSRLNFSIGMLLLPGFNAAAAFGFLDPFRAANYLSGEKRYDWDFLSLDQHDVEASNEAVITATRPFASSGRDYDLIVVNASWAPERFRSRRLKNWLVRASRGGTAIAAIDTGGFVLAYSGLLESCRATVHYEHIAAFKELFTTSSLDEVLYVSDRNRLTCCGGVAAIDMALSLLQKHNGLELANAAASYIFKDRHRGGDEKQSQHDPEPLGHVMPEKLQNAIILMERNLEEPLSIKEIARHLGISQRQLERVFRVHTGVTPVRYYINVRLDRARSLITQTDMPVAEIASACGFGSTEQFSRSYSGHFRIPPSQDRVEGRVPFQFRSFPIYAGV